MPVKSITDVLRDTINKTETPSKTLAKATGIPHPSIIRFRNGRSTIYLDAADKIAAYFGLELRPAEGPQRSKGKVKKDGQR